MFKVGDRVECLVSTGYEFTKGMIYEVGRVEKGGDWLKIKMDDKGSTTNGWAAKYFKPVKESTIRTVTRREIVPGTYGNLEVERHVMGLTVVFEKMNPTAEELREAAHIFNQLAEALEDKP